MQQELRVRRERSIRWITRHSRAERLALLAIPVFLRFLLNLRDRFGRSKSHKFGRSYVSILSESAVHYVYAADGCSWLFRG